MNTDELRTYIDHFIPREVLGPVAVVFASENIIDILLTRYMPAGHELEVWTILLLLSLITLGIWGLTGDDMDELEEDLEELP